MATVRTPVEGFTGVVAGVAFCDGVGATTDEGALAYFRRAGYTFEGESVTSDEPDFGSMRVADLRAFAATYSIDLGPATRKADIVAAIEAAVSTPADQSPEEPTGDEDGDEGGDEGDGTDEQQD